MRETLVLSETAIPDGLDRSDRWPGYSVYLEEYLSQHGISDRLARAENVDAVIVTASAPNPALSKALTRLSCMSVEIQPGNPNRHPNGAPNPAAEPLGADAIVYGLGDHGYSTALDLLAMHLRRPER